jgi:hypothetical protein
MAVQRGFSAGHVVNPCFIVVETDRKIFALRAPPYLLFRLTNRLQPARVTVATLLSEALFFVSGIWPAESWRGRLSVNTLQILAFKHSGTADEIVHFSSRTRMCLLNSLH